MASKSETKKITIIADGSQVNASLKSMTDYSKLLNNQLRGMTPGTDKFIKKAEELKGVRKKMQDVKDEMYGTETAMQKMTKGLGGLAAGLGLAFGVSTVFNFFKSSSEAAKDFEKSLSSLASITGATGEDLKFYEEQARLIGATTTLSASQAVEAFMLMGSARPELLKNKEALAAVTAEAVTLAEAAGIDLPAATQSLAGAMNQFQLPASEASRVINALAAGSKEGAANIPEITQAIDKFGVAASSFNVSFEESVGLVETLAEYNIKGAESGTALRNVLGRMATVKALPPEALAQLEKFGVDLDIVSDKTIPMNQRLAEFSKISGDATALTKVFGLENKIAGEVLLNNVGKFDTYTKAVTGTNTAVEQAAINTDNMAGRYKSLDSVIEDLKIGIGKFINAALLPMVNGFIAFILAIKEVPNFIRENRELITLLGVSILAMNGANIAAAASAIAHAAAEKGRAIATKASAAGQWLLNAAMTANPIGIVIAAVAGLIAVFANLYRTNTQVRASINGLWDAAKSAFSGIRDAAMSTLGGLGDLLVGIFTLDTDKIKSGWDSMTSSISAFADDTVNAYKDSYKSNLETANEEILAVHQEGADGVVEVEEVKNEELAAVSAEAAKERERKQKEHLDKMTKLKEDYAKAVVDQQKTLEDLELEMITSSSEKKQAKSDLEFQRELAGLAAKRQAILENEAITEQERNALLDQYAAEKRLRDEKKSEDDETLRLERNQEKLELSLTELDDENLILEEKRTQLWMDSFQSDFDKEEARLEMQREFLRRKLELLEQAGLGETLQAEKIKTAILKTDKEIADGRIAEAKRAEDFKFQVQQLGFEAAKGFMQLGLDLLGEESKARKVLANAMKAMEIGQIITQGIKEVQSIWAGAATLGPIAGPIVGGLQTGIAVARGAIAINKIRTTQYATGGQTGNGKVIDMLMGGDGTWRMPDGKSTRNIGSFAKGGPVGSASFGVIGERGSEWVGPNWMLQSPKYANIFGYLEAERRKAVPFASGGSTAPAQIPQNSSATGDLNQFMTMIEDFGAMKDVMEDIRDLIQDWPSTLRVSVDPRNIVSGIQVLTEIEGDSRINR